MKEVITTEFKDLSGAKNCGPPPTLVHSTVFGYYNIELVLPVLLLTPFQYVLGEEDLP